MEIPQASAQGCRFGSSWGHWQLPVGWAAAVKRTLLTVVAIAVVTLSAGCAGRAGQLGVSEPSATGTTLTVALYPWVPRPEQFEQAVSAEWAKVQPNVSLTFVPSSQWDGGYSDDPTTSMDVFVFDAMFLEYFRSQNYLEPMQASEIQDIGDFVPYAINGVQDSGQYYAIPQLGCANILFYQQSDTPLANATTLSQVKAALNQCSYTSEIPPDRRGLMVDMAGGTTNASLYIDTVHSLNGQYPFPLPSGPSQLNTQAINNMRELLAMASYANGTSDVAQPYERGTWFSNGWGRALIGYTEAMSAMTDTTLQGIGFKPMPLSDGNYPPVFYADVVGVNSATEQRGTRALAVQLANVIASSATMIASIGPDASDPSPQYLMATRPSVFQALSRSFPIYARMYGLITSSSPIMFKLDSQSRSWLNAMKGTIRKDARTSYPCACDQVASQTIPDDTAAPAICDATCSSWGGWTGAWTNEYPAAPLGQSVCGCKACPAP